MNTRDAGDTGFFSPVNLSEYRATRRARAGRAAPTFTFGTRKPEPAQRIETWDERCERLMARLKSNEPSASPLQHLVVWGGAFAIPFCVACSIFLARG